MSALESGRLGRVWSSRYSPLRAFWLLRVVYALLAVDLWFDMIEHGGRYGVGNFNVAHFAFLDRLLPLPSPELYVGILIASGFIATLLALGPAPRWLRLLLACLYTLAWMLSIHDSYQHHYLLSWLLFWCVALPDVSARRALDIEPVQGWGLPMSCITCAIVYAFTGIAKSEADWRSGDALRSITRSMPVGAEEPGKFDAARDLLLQLGLDDAAVWQTFALATIALQWLVALGYLAATRRDEAPSRVRGALVAMGLLAALSFHATAELFDVFEIGLFSYYMMLIACLLLGPLWPWRAPTRALAWLNERLESSAATATPRWLVRPLLSAALVLVVGRAIPLPGGLWASCFVAALIVLRVLLALRDERYDLDLFALKAALCAGLLWLAMCHSSVAFDYYRRTAGELYRMGRLREAIALYERGEQYAPAGATRKNRIRELQKELQQTETKGRF